MNTFYEHHHDSIRFTYRCFDRLYQRIVTDLDALWRAVGLRTAA